MFPCPKREEVCQGDFTRHLMTEYEFFNISQDNRMIREAGQVLQTLFFNPSSMLAEATPTFNIEQDFGAYPMGKIEYVIVG